MDKVKNTFSKLHDELPDYTTIFLAIKGDLIYSGTSNLDVPKLPIILSEFIAKELYKLTDDKDLRNKAKEAFMKDLNKYVDVILK